MTGAGARNGNSNWWSWASDTISLPKLTDTVDRVVVKPVKSVVETVDKYGGYILMGLGLVAVIVVVDTVGDVLD